MIRPAYRRIIRLVGLFDLTARDYESYIAVMFSSTATLKIEGEEAKQCLVAVGMEHCTIIIETFALVERCDREFGRGIRSAAKWLEKIPQTNAIYSHRDSVAFSTCTLTTFCHPS